MKFIITEEQEQKLILRKTQIIKSLIDRQITDTEDVVCKVEVSPPSEIGQHFSVYIYFELLANTEFEYLQEYRFKQEDIANEIWQIVYNFTNEPLFLYFKTCY